jgi:hypothetical protein
LVEKIWSKYLREFFEPYRVSTNPSSLIAPHYRELHVTISRKSLWVCLRRPVDGDTPQKRAKTLEYVSERLLNEDEEIELVIVTFGKDVELYDWKGEGSGGERLSGPRIRYEDYSVEASRVDFETNILMPWKKKSEHQ